ncbi:hypothetical protein DM02DRAFT_624851 [Periconia macrospinosa]|uniref:Uncharacterized protein n=1 Tax=Periconia macrospinosa TaxID=97972 RepID=A0A2V1E208_9PLEO|nr:hypothetical protein DM02DRAFT_624851 [Periconia macrospinosa]
MYYREKTQFKILLNWAQDSGVQLDDKLNLTECFERIAAKKRWKPGSKRWCTCWKHCFGNDYSPGSTTNNLTVDEIDAAPFAFPSKSKTGDDEKSAVDELTAATTALSLDSRNSGQAVSSENSNVDKLTATTTALSLDPKTKKSKKRGKKKMKSQGGVGINAIDAINAYFDNTYGTDVGKLEVWQQICIDVGLEAPATITKCKKALKGVLVNIHDFLEDSRPVPRFRSYNAFCAYTKAGRTYPLHKAKQDGFIKIFLKTVI